MGVGCFLLTLLPTWIFGCNSSHMLQQILPWQFQLLLCVFHLKLTFNELLVPMGAEQERKQQVSAGLTCPARKQAKETRRQQGKTQLSAHEIGGERNCRHLEDSWKI